MNLKSSVRSLLYQTEKSAQRIRFVSQPADLPILLAIIPSLYHYSNNVEKLTLVSLYHMLALNAVLAIIVYAVALIIMRFNAFKAANAAFVFLIFFNLYGLAYRYLLNLDLFRIKHYTLIPLFLLLAVYAAGFIVRWNDTVTMTLWKNLILVCSLLVIFNLFLIIPAEWQKWKSNTTQMVPLVQDAPAVNQKSPDIYYIIMDEFSGFQGMRDYWKYQEVDEFAS